MARPSAATPSAAYTLHNPAGAGRWLLICEHASAFIPMQYRHLGLAATDRERHIAWDIGALALARELADRLDSPLVYATHSRLLLDLNREPSAHDFIVGESEGTTIPGNRDLHERERQRRIEQWYHPFHDAVAGLLDARRARGQRTAVASIHSFTPVYHGRHRPWQVGVLSHRDRRLADRLLQRLRLDPRLCVGDNQPYRADQGVFHTMARHAEARDLPGLMIEVRNDLLASAAQQQHWADRLALGFEHALGELDEPRNGSP